MALELGNLLGAAANLTTAISKEKSLKSFLQQMTNFGIQVTNNFEVNIFGIEDVTFFVQSVTLGGLVQDFTELHYNGRAIPIPGYVDYEHNGSMKVINDANGYIYAAISNFLMTNTPSLIDNGVVMTIKCLTGDPKYKGALITLNNVRFENLSGLEFQYSGGEPSMFTLSFRYLDFTFTPGALGKAAGIIGAVDKLIS